MSSYPFTPEHLHPLLGIELAIAERFGEEPDKERPVAAKAEQKKWRRLTFVVNAGEKTCASKPGEFCQFTGAKKMGTHPWCMLFNQELGTIDGKDTGWLERLDECIKAEKET